MAEYCGADRVVFYRGTFRLQLQRIPPSTCLGLGAEWPLYHPWPVATDRARGVLLVGAAWAPFETESYLCFTDDRADCLAERFVPSTPKPTAPHWIE